MTRLDTFARLALSVIAIIFLSGAFALASHGEGGHEPPSAGHDETQSAAHGEDEASQQIPDLPFADNTDPEACGIPQRWGRDDPAWLSGFYEGELIEPIVHLYDSHLRREITAKAPTRTQVRVILFQDNPVLNYYLVEVVDEHGEARQGWVPAPFLVFEEPS